MGLGSAIKTGWHKVTGWVKKANPVLKWLGGLIPLAALVVALLAWLLPVSPSTPAGPTQAPTTTSTSGVGPGGGTPSPVNQSDQPIIVHTAVGPRCPSVSPAPNVEVHGDQMEVTLNVVLAHPDSPSVTLTGMRVIVDKRSQPSGSATFCSRLGSRRQFAVDLDQAEPYVQPEVGGRDENGAPSLQPVPFPFTLSTPKDQETLTLTAHTQSCDCAWHIELNWITPGRPDDPYVIPHDGSQFRTIATRPLFTH